MESSFAQKQEALKALFAGCKTKEERYLKIIQLGRSVCPLKKEWKTEANRVEGCQSATFLHCRSSDGILYFHAESDALISAGLAQILISVYSGETPETILKSSPLFLEELEIGQSLSPGRANGLYSIHLKMRQDALKHLVSIG